MEYNRYDGCVYKDFFESAETMKDNWEPVSQGLFDGKYDNYKTCRDSAEKYYQDSRGYY